MSSFFTWVEGPCSGKGVKLGQESVCALNARSPSPYAFTPFQLEQLDNGRLETSPYIGDMNVKASGKQDKPFKYFSYLKTFQSLWLRSHAAVLRIAHVKAVTESLRLD